MRSIAGRESGISRHQSRCLGVGAVGCEAGYSVQAGGAVAFNNPQGRRGAPARARRLSHSDQWTHPVIVDVGEAGLGELVVQPVVPAAGAGHVDFQGVEIFPVLPGRCLRAGTGVWRRISP